MACAIYRWANPDADSIVDLSASDVPLLFPFSCLMTNSVVALGPMFISIPLCVIFIFGLTGDQGSVVVVSCAASYFIAHGLGQGLLPKVTEKKVLKLLALLDEHRLERIEKAIKKLNGLDTRRDTLEAAVEAADRAEEMARDLEYEVVSAAPDGEQLADDYEELGGGR